MPRKQTPQTLANKTVAAPATPEALTASTTLVGSFLVQALSTNTDFVYIGDSAAQNYALAPGKGVEIHGDNLDHGTGAILDISQFYCRVLVAGNGVSIFSLSNY